MCEIQIEIAMRLEKLNFRKKQVGIPTKARVTTFKIRYRYQFRYRFKNFPDLISIVKAVFLKPVAQRLMSVAKRR